MLKTIGTSLVASAGRADRGVAGRAQRPCIVIHSASSSGRDDVEDQTDEHHDDAEPKGRCAHHRQAKRQLWHFGLACTGVLRDVAPCSLEVNAVLVHHPYLSDEPGDEEQEPDEDDPSGAGPRRCDLPHEALTLSHHILIAADIADPVAGLLIDVKSRTGSSR
jgi:hypothetical protein